MTEMDTAGAPPAPQTPNMGHVRLTGGIARTLALRMCEGFVRRVCRRQPKTIAHTQSALTSCTKASAEDVCGEDAWAGTRGWQRELLHVVYQEPHDHLSVTSTCACV